MARLIEVMHKYHNGGRSKSRVEPEELSAGMIIAITQALDGDESPNEELFEEFSHNKILAMIEIVDKIRGH